MDSWMELALDEAKASAHRGEVPVGAVVIDRRTQSLIARAGNQMVASGSPLAHAELLALEKAFQETGESRLSFCNLYVTLEPCPMCAQAISFARVGCVYFGAYDAKGGGVEHGARIFQAGSCFHKPDVWGGVQESACSQLLKDFFKQLR
ncbi:MAG: nucleoside deaminase [Alphaproteobacteria bacterium]